jgi:hypothetical protein
MCFLVTFQSFVWVKGLIVGHVGQKIMVSEITGPIFNNGRTNQSIQPNGGGYFAHPGFSMEL